MSCEVIIHELKCGMSLSARKDEINGHIFITLVSNNILRFFKCCDYLFYT